MFPGPGAQIYRNEEGEVLGWDYPSYDEPDYDEDRMNAADIAAEEAWENGYEQGEADAEEGLDPRPEDFASDENTSLHRAFMNGYRDGYETVKANQDEG